MTTGLPLSERVAANVAAMRRARAMTQQDLSGHLAKIGHPLRLSGVSKVEKGQRAVTLDDLAALAAVFGISNPWELTGELCPVCANSPAPGLRCLTCDRAGDMRSKSRNLMRSRPPIRPGNVPAPSGREHR